jgi:Flp pilus assembly protein TadB
MSLVLLALCGAGVGTGLALTALILYPARPALGEALAAPNRTPAAPRPAPGSVIQKAGSPVVPLLTSLGLPRARTRADLTALDRPVEIHLAQQAGLGLLGLVAGPVYALALGLVGVKLPAMLLALGTLALAAAGFILPSQLARTDAAKLREQIRYATSALLDLVAVMLAAGAGQEEAFTLAASTGTGPGHDQLRSALAAAHTTHAPVWDSLNELGTRTGVRELTELAATSSLAGTEGARIRATLTTKAASLRARLLSTAEAKAASATERMGLPTVLLMAGFLVFTCYPALAKVMDSL